MAGPGICILCMADTLHLRCTPVFNPVAPYGYLLPNVYLFMAHIAIPYLFVGPGFVTTSPAFMRSSASHPTGPNGRFVKKTVNRAPIAGGGRFRHNVHRSLYLL